MAQRIVGLDIGTSAIRAVELTVGDGSMPVLEAFGQVGLNPGTVVDGEIRDQLKVVEAIERLWHEGGFSEHKVIVGVAGLRAITREVDMPPMPPDELDDAVKFQADQVIPFPLERTAMSANVIAQYNDADGNPQIRVLVAAAHRDLIDAVVGAVQAAGLEPVGIDLDTAALARALYDPTFGGGPEAIVSVGAGLTMVVVHQGGLLQFVRTIDLGGQTVSKAVASALDIPLADAEDVKRKLEEPGLHDSRAESAVAGAVEDLVAEIHNSIRFFSSLPGRGEPSRLLVTGAGARTPGFLTRLQQGIETPVLPASPLSMVDTSRLPISPEQAAAINPTLAVPVGLALPDPSGKPFNLLPAEIAAEYAKKRMRNMLIIAAAAVVVLLALLTVWRVLAVHSKENAVASLTAQKNYINNVEIPKYDKEVALRAQVQAQQAALVPLVAGETNFLIVLNQIGDYQTDPATLSNLTLTEVGATAAGTPSATTPTAASALPTSATIIATASGNLTVATLPQVTQWGLSMSQSPAFEGVSLGGSTLTPGNNLSFMGSWSINGNAHSERINLFDQPLPK